VTRISFVHLTGKVGRKWGHGEQSADVTSSGRAIALILYTVLAYNTAR